ncbi:MAG TPA: KOW domain-containing RNA-binding protein [Bacillota bacterium]
MGHGLRPGQLVTSRAGRDKGKPFFVIRVLDERYVEVADGETRSGSRPKRKNVRHLQPHRWVHEGLAERLARDDIPPDEELRQMLEAMIETATRGGVAPGGSG